MDGRLAIRLERWAISRADQVFSPSHFLAKVVSSSLGIPVEVVQTPFKLERHTYDDLPYIDCMKGKAYLLFFGTISFLKGVSTIAKILRTLLNENPDLHFVFIGKDVGYGGRPMMSCVWDLAGSHRGRVLYLGAMRHEQLFPFLANALAVVLPSRIDNFPNACIEAMAFRKIVIGTTGSSFEELIKDGESGFLCPPDSPEELLSTVRKIIALPVSERIRIGKNAARRIEELHPEVTGRKLVEYLTSAAVERIA
jgi:glycosyltransferase involved in cell wall biosynthesis